MKFNSKLKLSGMNQDISYKKIKELSIQKRKSKINKLNWRK